jgi:hypothetical protein
MIIYNSIHPKIFYYSSTTLYTQLYYMFIMHAMFPFFLVSILILLQVDVIYIILYISADEIIRKKTLDRNWVFHGYILDC